MRRGIVVVAVSGVAVGFLLVFASMHQPAPSAHAVLPAPAIPRDLRAPVALTPTPASSADAPSAALFERNRNMPADPDLAAEFDEINTNYFHNVLAPTVTRWESGLAELGPAIAEGFTVQGLTDGHVILLNPSVMHDADQRRRALCHEMVHVAVWAQDVEHGPVFQDQLRQLSLLGAFKGIIASEEEKDAALARIQRTRVELETEERTLNSDRDAVDRTSQAAVDAFNARARRQQEAVAVYNRLVEQYNLMISYPDGLARERLKPRADGTMR
jgi:hypothetical protein